MGLPLETSFIFCVLQPLGAILELLGNILEPFGASQKGPPGRAPVEGASGTSPEREEEEGKKKQKD